MLPIVNESIRRQRNVEASQRLRLQRRQLRDESAPYALSDERFVELFRLNKTLVRNLIERLQPNLNGPRYTSGIAIETKVFTALRFYATGSYQRGIGEDYKLGLSQTSVHRCIHEVTAAIDTSLRAEYITFPHNRRTFNENKALFMRKFGFPGVIGAVDGTHIAVLKPLHEEHNFINRKGFHSLNVQVICDSNLKIIGLNANFPGSCHDSFIWRQSQARQFLHGLYFQNNERGTWLIGDSGYPLEPFLMTPFSNASAETPESRYNVKHASARNCVERCIGLLKMRFRCILKERVARYSPSFVGSLTNVCAVLHNMCILGDVPFQNDLVLSPEENIQPSTNSNNDNLNNLLGESRRIRQDIVNRYFQ